MQSLYEFNQMKKLLILCVLAGLHAHADSVSYVGSLDPADPNSVALFSVTLVAPSDLNIQTWGYGGGINAAGDTIAEGGFDPYVSLFAGDGDSATFVAANDDGLCPPGNESVACHDSTLNLDNLAAGSYIVALTVFGNSSFAENFGSGSLGDGFIGLADYFDQASGLIRAAHYAIDITTSAPVPEPATSLLLVPALLLIVVAPGARGTDPRT